MGKFNKVIMKQNTVRKEEKELAQEGQKIDVGAGLFSPASASAKESPLKEMETIYVIPENIYRSEDNTISMDENEIEALAESFREVGMLNPLIVKKDDGDRYRIVCGEKRYRATLWNIDHGFRRKEEPVKCNLFDPKLIDLKGFSDEEKEDYVRDEENVLQRNKTDADKLMLMRKYEARYKLMRERDPEKMKGIKTRTLLIQDLHMSGAQIAQFKKVENQGSAELIKAVEDEQVNITTAVDIAGMEKSAQKELIEQALRGKKENEKIGKSDVLKFRHDKKMEQEATKAPVISKALENTLADPETPADSMEQAEPVAPEQDGTFIDEKIFKKDLKTVFKKLHTANGVILDEKQYFTYLQAIASLEKLFND